MSNYSIFNVLSEASSERPQAIIREAFLFPTTPLPELLGNSTFIDSLDCMTASSDGNSFQNISCAEGCGNVENIFANWPNFYTCSWYPSIADTLNVLSVNTLEVETLHSLGIVGSQQTLVTNISSDIANCLNDYCASSSTCQTLDSANHCSLESLLISNGSSQSLNRSSAVSCMRDSVCGTTTETNPDIGGLGVILSLLIQYSISILSLFVHAAFYVRFCISTRTAGPATPVQAIDAEASPAKKSYDRHLEALTSALVEFQKSQCFFAATLQIASLIIVPSFQIGAHTKDKILLRLTSANAFAPIMLTLTHIDFLGGRNSIYVLLLSFVTFALGTAAYWLSLPYGYGGGNEFFNYTPPAVPVMSCGDIAPFAPCYLQNEFFLFDMWPGNTGVFYTGPERTGLAVWIISLGILLFRIGYALAKSGWSLKPRAKANWDQMVQDWKEMKSRVSRMRVPKPMQRALAFWRKLPTTVALKEAFRKLFTMLEKRRSWLYIQLFLGTAALVMQLVSSAQVLLLSANIIATQMTFGQIVAVGIWIPVFLEYGYLEMVGASEGTEYRLKTPLIVATPVVTKSNPGP